MSKEHKVLHGEPHPVCSCGYSCKTDAGMETHLKNAHLHTELREERKQVNDLKRELNKCDCGVCDWCNGSTYYHSKQRAEKAEAELAELRERLKPVEEVYENYNHGKGLYCDMQVIFDLWQAIKAACEKKEKMDEI